MKKRILALLSVLAALSMFAAAQSQNAPLVMDKPGDKDDSTRLIEAPRVSNLTPTSATIEWKTNGPAANHIRYGLIPGRPDKNKYEPGGSQDHSLTLSDLEPGKTYYFYILERDQEVRQGGTGSFTTPVSGQAGVGSAASSGQGASALQITNGPGAMAVTATSAVIFWNTSAPSGSVVHYGTSPNALDQTAQSPWGQTAHRVELKNLQPNTTYYFQAESGQAQGTGTGAMSGIEVFKTKPQ